MKTIKAIALAMMMVTGTSVSAQLLDTSVPDYPFDIGVRAGVNVSNSSNNYSHALQDCDWASTDWGTGFTAGAVIDMKIRNYLAVQPGVFFQSRSMNFLNLRSSQQTGGDAWMRSEEGHVNSYNINIPIMLSLRMTFSPVVQVNAEVGPYFQWSFGGENKCNLTTVEANKPFAEPVTVKRDLYGDKGYMRTFDWGVKMGVSFVFADYYSLGVHYMAGCRNIYEQPASIRHDLNGKNKSWDITLGYTIY